MKCAVRETRVSDPSLRPISISRVLALPTRRDEVTHPSGEGRPAPGDADMTHRKADSLRTSQGGAHTDPEASRDKLGRHSSFAYPRRRRRLFCKESLFVVTPGPEGGRVRPCRKRLKRAGTCRYGSFVASGRPSRRIAFACGATAAAVMATPGSPTQARRPGQRGPIALVVAALRGAGARHRGRGMPGSGATLERCLAVIFGRRLGRAATPLSERS